MTDIDIVLDTHVFTCSDNKKVSFGEAFLKHSVLVSEMFDDDPSNEMQDIPLLCYNSEVVSNCVAFCELYEKNPYFLTDKPISSNIMSKIVPEWCANFLDIPVDKILEMMKTANYLHMDILLNTTCVKVATLIKGKTAEEIRKIFSINDDFNTEEKKELENAHKWALEGKNEEKNEKWTPVNE